jgi:hypothetical protein
MSDGYAPVKRTGKAGQTGGMQMVRPASPRSDRPTSVGFGFGLVYWISVDNQCL